MLYYKVLNKNGSLLGAINLDAFRFYSPKRQRMYITNVLKEAQYIIFNGEYYKVSWLCGDPYNKGKYPEVDLVLIDKEEYLSIQAEKEESDQK